MGRKPIDMIERGMKNFQHEQVKISTLVSVTISNPFGRKFKGMY